jgi:hypothetical protein
VSITKTLNLTEVVESWVADRDLSTAEHEWLHDMVQSAINEPIGLPLTAPHDVCTDVDLPQGSAWIEVAASVLDAFDKTGNEYLNAIRDLYELGSQEEA